MDRQKKPHHHNETGRKCRAAARGLARLPQAAATVLKGYFSSEGDLPEKCGV